jgi:hypothetical protein
MSIIIVQNDSIGTKHASHCANSIHPADQQEFEEFRARQSDEAGELKLTLIALVMPATACKWLQRVSIMLPR